MIAYIKLEGMWEEAALAYFNALKIKMAQSSLQT
jgi:hypothetical protein